MQNANAKAAHSINRMMITRKATRQQIIQQQSPAAQKKVAEAVK
jgi:hypothetical protein